MKESADSLAPLLGRILDRCECLGDECAVSYADPLDGFRRKELSYAGLGASITEARARLRAHPEGPVCILAQKTPGAYAALLAALLDGRPFIPLNPRHPEGRLRAITHSSGAALLVADPPRAEAGARLAGASGLPFERAGGDIGRQRDGPLPAASSGPAYVMFTSGSAGEPKGVVVGRAALACAVAAYGMAVGPARGARFSQAFELSFDLSLGEILYALSEGGRLCAIDALELPSTPVLLEREGIEVWGSAPSLVQMLSQAGLLPAGANQKLHFSLFCGEILKHSLALEWQRYAPGSRVENFYGPTEATLYVSSFAWSPDFSPGPSGSVSIGNPFPGHQFALVAGEDRLAGPGESGELWIRGPQLAEGYLNAPGPTAAAFVSPPWLGGGRWYRTGDRAGRGPRGFLEVLGRMDAQAKVRGHRIEMEEVEACLARAHPAAWIAVPDPLDASGAAEGVAALVPKHLDAAEIERILEGTRDWLPAPAVPAAIYRLGEWPLTISGKLDRAAAAAAVRSGRLERLFPPVSPRRLPR